MRRPFMLFDHCAQCQRCCHIEPDFPPLEVSLTQDEARVYGSICIESSCTHLGARRCDLGDAKPVSCKLYPLSFAPNSRTFQFDIECPLKDRYFEQLSDPKSEASLHLLSMSKIIKKLEKTDSAFLLNNYAIDVDYFELEAVPRNPFEPPK